jgi:hypothetical protein
MLLRSRPQFSWFLVFLALVGISVTVRPSFGQNTTDDAELHKQMALGEALLGKTPDRAAVLYFLAQTHALLHEPHEAIAKLKECLAAKEGFDPSGDPVFQGLKFSPEFQHLTGIVHKDFPEVSRAQLAFVIPEKDLIPEGIAYDPDLDVFYLSSLHSKKILRIPRSAPARYTDFVPGDKYNLQPTLGIRMDPTDGSVWSASWLDNGKTELLHFEKSGTLLGRHSLPDEGQHGFNDLVVTRDGGVYVTDTAGNQVFHFDPKAKQFQALTLNRPTFQPNGIALSDDQQFLFIADQFGVLRYEIKSGHSADVAPGASNTLAGADGLYFYKNALIAVQNGIGSPRIAAFQLSGDFLRVTKTTILEDRSVFTALPTTGAICGDKFYFIVNSQIDNLNGDRILDVTRLAPVRIGVLALP